MMISLPRLENVLVKPKAKVESKSTLRDLFRKRNAEIGDGFRFEKSKKKRKKDRKEDSNFRDDRDNGVGRERDLSRYYIKFNQLFRDYLSDIERITGTPMLDKQKRLIEEAVKNNKYMKLSPEKSKEHRREYSSKRKELIAEWERQTGMQWGRYTEPVYSKNGKIVRNVGDAYDFHHCILSSYSGDNQWWNGFPAKFPSEHQMGIHRKGGLCKKIFKQ